MLSAAPVTVQRVSHGPALPSLSADDVGRLLWLPRPLCQPQSAETNGEDRLPSSGEELRLVWAAARASACWPATQWRDCSLHPRAPRGLSCPGVPQLRAHWKTRSWVPGPWKDQLPGLL